VFAKRNIDLSERERQAPPAIDSRTFLSAIPAVPLKRTFQAEPAIAREPSDEEIDLILKAGEFESRSEVVDCGACGYDTCVEHAAAICLGNSSWEMCFPLAKKKLVRERERYAQQAVTDELTGLHNRRAFDARLAEEVARAGRYHTPLSLAMLDLDGFKEVNDSYGHNAGDALLRPWASCSSRSCASPTSRSATAVTNSPSSCRIRRRRTLGRLRRRYAPRFGR